MIRKCDKRINEFNGGVYDYDVGFDLDVCNWMFNSVVAEVGEERIKIPKLTDKI